MIRNSLLAITCLTTAFYTQKRSQCCGIIGIVTNQRKNVNEFLSQGIQLLKNRGYDSAGIVTFDKEDNKVTARLTKFANQQSNSQNCIQRLVKEVSRNLGQSSLGIGHTRWATCGEKVIKNAHPHYDQQKSIFLVHNGIISNHSKIKSIHLNQICFNSDTDTQVLVQLLGKFRKSGKTMIESLKKLEQIVGKKQQWGLVIMDKNEPNKIYTSTNNSPILIGFGNQQIYIASEIIAFQKNATEYFQTQNGQIFQLSIQNLENIKSQITLQGRIKKINKNIAVLKNPLQPYKTFYQYQINQQKQIKFQPDYQRIKSIPFGKYLTILGCGSSYYAGLSCKYLFQKLKCFNKITILDPVELFEGDIEDNETVVMISQSGETADLIKIVNKCKQQKNVSIIGIINVEGSTLARKVDFPIYIKVGRQVSVAATKSLFFQILNLMQFGTEVAQQKGSADLLLIKTIREQLLLAPNLVGSTIEMVSQKCRELASIIYQKQSIYLLAMRQALGIAKQAALKIKQLNYIHAEALGACEMKHGPIALIDSENKHSTVVILFVLDNQTYPQLINAMDQMHSRNAYVIVITDCPQKILDDSDKKKTKNETQKYNYMIEIPKLGHISHLISLIPMQILVNEIAKLKNINPDMPRNLAKTVTV